MTLKSEWPARRAEIAASAQALEYGGFSFDKATWIDWTAPVLQ
jgi:hypothetical protein